MKMMVAKDTTMVSSIRSPTTSATGPVVFERVTVIAGQHAAEPDEILLDHRLIQAVGFAQELEPALVDGLAPAFKFRHQRRQVVARRKLDDDEGDGADREQGRDHHHDPSHEEAQHGDRSSLL